MIIKNKTTKENKEFWEHIERIAREVEQWPDWMRSTYPIGEAGKQKYSKEKP